MYLKNCNIGILNQQVWVYLFKCIILRKGVFFFFLVLLRGSVLVVVIVKIGSLVYVIFYRWFMCLQVIKVMVVEVFIDIWSLGLSWGVVFLDRGLIRYEDIVFKFCGQQWKLIWVLFFKGIVVECFRDSNGIRFLVFIEVRIIFFGVIGYGCDCCDFQMYRGRRWSKEERKRFGFFIYLGVWGLC